MQYKMGLLVGGSDDPEDLEGILQLQHKAAKVLSQSRHHDATAEGTEQCNKMTVDAAISLEGQSLPASACKRAACFSAFELGMNSSLALIPARSPTRGELASAPCTEAAPAGLQTDVAGVSSNRLWA
ncbi:MAG: hypothetical protein FRX49_11554 [Trebouxia sp. A1-2]|nr:MAG: hypothetical protein FRX49_11554 [Trebouxia sp. A1-2]